jgi:hypothetical protein
MLPAIIWWLSQADPNGKTIVSIVCRDVIEYCDLGGPWEIGEISSLPDRGEVEHFPTIPDGVRRSLARWFRHKAVWATTLTEVDNYIAAAKQILPPTDVTAWEPLFTALRQRFTIADKAPNNADLITRLQSWKSTTHDALGKKINTPKVPAKRSDTDALVALLDDKRPTRWVTDYALPRPLGDVALEALGELWGFDWRWLVVDNPAVAALLPPPYTISFNQDDAEEFDDGDESLWRQTAWTAERRAVIMPAIKAWWNNRTPANLSPLSGVFRTLPLSLWRNLTYQLSVKEFTQPELGDIFAERLKTIAPLELDIQRERNLIPVIMQIMLRHPQHTGIKTIIDSWPPSPWMDVIAPLQSELANDPATFERWLNNQLFIPPHYTVPSDDLVNPWNYLGITVHRPSTQRLATLRKILNGDKNDPRFAWLVSQIGQFCWFDNSDLLPNKWQAVVSNIAQGIPCALAQDGLNDQRIISPALREIIINGIGGNNGNSLAKQLPLNARICDWTATQLLEDGGVLDGNRGNIISQKEFLTLNQTKRDGVITELEEKLKPIAEEKIKQAKLIADPILKPDDVTDF